MQWNVGQTVLCVCLLCLLLLLLLLLLGQQQPTQIMNEAEAEPETREGKADSF